MNYRDGAELRRDLEQSLERRYGNDDLSLAHARKDIVFDRVLARIVAAVPERWSLSGDLALALRFPERPREGWSLNIEWPIDRYDAVDETPFQIMEHAAGDFFELELERSGSGSVGDRSWKKFNVHASLEQQHFSTAWLRFDLNYGPLPTERLLTKDVLGFAGIQPTEVETVLLEIQAGELLRSHVGKCKSGLDPARLDDLRDLALIAARSGLDAETLGTVIDQIFARREADPPKILPHPFEGWAEPLRRMAEMAGSPADFLAGYDGVAALFNPILSGEVVEGTWDAVSQSWGEPSSSGRFPLM